MSVRSAQIHDRHLYATSTTNVTARAAARWLYVRVRVNSEGSWMMGSIKYKSATAKCVFDSFVPLLLAVSCRIFGMSCVVAAVRLKTKGNLND